MRIYTNKNKTDPLELLSIYLSLKIVVFNDFCYIYFFLFNNTQYLLQSTPNKILFSTDLANRILEGEKNVKNLDEENNFSS